MSQVERTDPPCQGGEAGGFPVSTPRRALTASTTWSVSDRTTRSSWSLRAAARATCARCWSASTRWPSSRPGRWRCSSLGRANRDTSPGLPRRPRDHRPRPVAAQRAGAVPGPGVGHPVRGALAPDPGRGAGGGRRDPAHPHLPRARPSDRGARRRRAQPGVPHHRPQRVPGLPGPGSPQRPLLPARGDHRRQCGGSGHRRAHRHPPGVRLPGGRRGRRAQRRPRQRLAARGSGRSRTPSMC